MITATYKRGYYDVEYSIVNVSELEGELRIDAEYYDPFYLKNEEKIKRKKWIFLKDSLKNKKIRKPSNFKRIYIEKGIPIILAQNIREIFLDFSQRFFTIKQKITEKPKYKDILITVTGANVGQNVIFLEKDEHYLTTDAAIIRVNEDVINPFYLVIFLNTNNYFKKNITRYIYGAAQPHLSLNDFTYFKIPIPSDTFQKFIEKLVLKAYEERKKAEELYKQAEEILLEELGLKDWKPKTKKINIGGKEFEEEENISIRMLFEVMKADRLDAEYWEPKYDELEEKIRSFEYEKLYKLASNSYETFNPENCDYFYYLEIANVDLVTGDYELKKLPCSSVPSRAKKLVEEKDILVSTVRPNRNAVAFIIRKDNDPFVASTGFCKLKVTNERILPEYLFVLFKTDLYKELLVRKTTATMYPAVSENDIMQLDIPILPKDTQERIKDMIMEGFQSKENSKKLLEIAKRTVEIYIEKDEKEGLNYARNKIKELRVEID